MATAVCSADPGAFPAPIAEAVKQAVVHTLGSICGAPPTVRDQSGDGEPCAGAVGIIAFLGDVSWSLSLLLPEATAGALVEKFYGFAIPFDSPDMGDAVGELANILAGDVSARLECQRIKAQMSLPTVARGHDVALSSPVGKPSLRLEFDCPHGRFGCRLTAARPGESLGRRPGI